MGSGPGVQVTAARPSSSFPGPYAYISLDAARVGGLKLEMLEKYSGSQTPAIHGWLNKMEQYFSLMRYLADVWVDVIATCITYAAQAWLDKSL